MGDNHAGEPGSLREERRALSPARLLVIEHEADAPLALFGAWLGNMGIAIDVVQPWDGASVPAQIEADGLVVLGGAMSAVDDEVAPWLPATRSLLRRAVAGGVPTLGICLGAQLMTVACGGRVERGKAGPELGVCGIELTSSAASDPLFAPLRPPVVAAQWHLDAIAAAPPGAVVLASSERYAVQAFRLGAAAWGVQFHPEVDRSVMAGWATEHDDTFTPAQLSEAVEAVGEAEPIMRATWQGVAERFGEIAQERSTRP
jgi:GMP synthase-like glutamine amidotransferase